jgi:general secretion pathway protein J
MTHTRLAKGFTLIEVLIAMTLLSLMVVLLFASLKICAESWEKGESKMADSNQVAVVYHFFQQHLATAQPLRDDFSVKEQSTLAFQGEGQSLQFVGEFPASAGKAGAQLFSLRLQEFDDGKAIVVALKPFYPLEEGKEPPKEEVVLIKRVRSLELAYLGDDGMGGESSWQNQWLERETQPQLVKVRIELESAIFWPEMVIELKVAGAGAADGALTESEQDTQDEQMQQDSGDIGQ